MAEPAPPRSIRRRLYAFAFLDELGPLFAIYTLWFDDNGISAAQVSTVFFLWAAVSIVLEVPSGALADRVDRRRLVAVALVLRAAGIAVWLVWPSYVGVLTGAMLWATHTAFASGAWEALVHDQLSATGEAEDYPVVMARLGQLGHVAIAIGTVSATALLGVGVSIPMLGWVTVALHGASVTAISGLPNIRVDEEDEDLSYGAWWRTVVTGARATVRSSKLGYLVLIAALLEGLFVVDEYVPLLGRLRGASDAHVPLLVLAVWVGLLLGGELAARRPRMGGRTLAGLLLVGAATMAWALMSNAAWALGLIGVGYAAMSAAHVITEARVQEHAPSAARATVLSVVGLLGAVLNSVMFVIVGAVDARDPAPGLLVAPPLLVIGAVMMAARMASAGAPAAVDIATAPSAERLS